MSELLPDLVSSIAPIKTDRPALAYKDEVLRYGELWYLVSTTARALVELGLQKSGRVAVYLEKRIETVVALLAAAAAGGVFVPVNPLLRARQVGYILRDCNVRVLVTSPNRLRTLKGELADCPDLHSVVLVDGDAEAAQARGCDILPWEELLASAGRAERPPHRVIDTDMAAILYTSGSTGQPKGVVLSHRNLVCGAKSVCRYLDNNEEDRILAVLPLSFDAGLSQVITAFCAGATAVLMNYLLPRDVVRACASERITGLTGVPPLWIQLAQQNWPREAAESLRYFANTGGHMPRHTLDKLRVALPRAKPFLMYGLTEAFRSTYLDPAEVDRRPDSIGKAIPNAEILVVRKNGELCAPGEEGELVHRGALVSMGYWNDPQRTAERFRPAPGRPAGLALTEIAVWSGDIVRTDQEGFIYFVGRRDEMIKTSGYRVSPTEVEDVVYTTGLVREAVAIGIPHPVLGQSIVVVAVAAAEGSLDSDRLMQECRGQLPLYMVPGAVVERRALPRSPNGKIDRKALAKELSDMFQYVST